MPQRRVSFFALAPAPASSNGIELITNSGSSYTGYPAFRVTPPAAPAQQLDLCVASALDRTEAGGTVSFIFAHAMAKLKFSAKYDSEHTPNKSFGLVLRQLKLTGIYNSSTLHFNASGFEWDMPTVVSSEYALSVVDNTLVGTPLLELDEVGDATVSTDDGTLMLIPQTIPIGAKLEITLWVGDKTEERTIDISNMTLEAGKQYTYNLKIADNYMSNVLDKMVWNYDYTGNWQTFVAPEDGIYKLEVWGAGGLCSDAQNASLGGNGGYAAGTIELKLGQLLYIYIGEATKGTAFNGGAQAGGGATDIRLVAGSTWNDALSLNSRILVAGGGGGTGYDAVNGDSNGKYVGPGGAAGGLEGYNGAKGGGSAYAGLGGTQTAGGGSVSAGSGAQYTSSAGSYGTGSAGANGNVAGGGGGYYGGSGGARGDHATAAAGGGGGSSFISGMLGCKAIDPALTSNPRTQDTEDTDGDITALNYNKTVFGSSPTWSEGVDIVFTNPSMIDGQGYEWNTGAKVEPAIGMPDWNNDGSTMPGNVGNGHARITRIPPSP
jgi:hypothetical protein